MASTDLRGIIAAATTPVDESFQIDPVRLTAHCERLLSDGCSFISTFGTTGEGASLSSAQKIKALGRMKAEGADLTLQIPSIMTSTADEAGSMLSEIARLGCRAALVLPPFYYDFTSHEGVVAFFDDMLAKAGKPDIDLLLYNIPRFSGIAYTPELIDLIRARYGSRIVGIKDSTGIAENSEMLAKRYPDMAIFTGDDRVMPGLILAGGAGMIGGMPNVFSSDLRKIYEAPDGAETAPLREKASRRIDVVNEFGGHLALKATLAVLYKDKSWARCVPPMLQLSQTDAERVLAAFAETGYAPARAA